MTTDAGASRAHLPFSPAGLESVFRHYDADGDGRISPAELCACTLSTGHELSLEDAEAMVASVDSDGDGYLGLDDFAKLAMAEEGEDIEVDMRKAFSVYLTEGLNYITAGSLCSALDRLGTSMDVEDCKAMIRRFDLNGDGVISFDEFRIMLAC